MAMTGLQILKLLPKTNCKECGSNTCLAFAMKLAGAKASLSECPYASEEAKQVLGAASEPPVKSVTFGPDKSLVLGGETVLYRHEKTFVNQPRFAVNLNDTDSPQSIDETLKACVEYTLERVGEKFFVDMIAVTQKSSDTDTFVKLAVKAWEIAKKPLVLYSSDPKSLIQAAAAVKNSHSLICSANAQTADALVTAARENRHALALTATDLDALTSLSAKIKDSGFNDLVLQFQAHSPAEYFQTNTIARRTAIKDNYKPLGYPSIRFIEDADIMETAVMTAMEICKYGGICVLPNFDPALLATMMTLRLNIFTDPQKPIQVEPKVYPVGDPKPDSPIFVTTNFSLTYFIVSGEIENSGTSAWLVVPECEGLSVLTAWAAGKFSGAMIAKFVKDIALENQVTRREIIIPGYVAQISGELEEALTGWKVVVGPQEAADLESFIKTRLN